MDASALGDLRRQLGDRLTEAPEALTRLASDASHLSCPPAAAVRPSNPEEVTEVVRWARRHRVPLIPRGGGTSLDGESVPVPGSVVVDLSAWGTIHEIDPVDRVARVGPGVINRALQAAAAPARLFFPPNPGSWGSSTLGGNASTNASGPRSFKYGPTRSWVRAAEVVLGTGERVSVGGRSAKRSTGPDLLHLMIGSEGTLGIFTELTVTLAPTPSRRAVLAVAIPPAISLGAAAGGLAYAVPDGVSAVEYLDATCAAALASVPGARLPGDRPLLLIEVESEDPDDEAARMARLAARLRGLGITDDPIVFADADRLWTLRGTSGEALDRTMGLRIREDVGVPVARIDEFVRSLERIASDASAATCLYGHLGEGSLHPNVAIRPGTPRGEEVRQRVLAAAVRCGGSLSAEHGIGLVKASAWSDQVGAEGRRILRAVKSACDPDGILNPGKVLPDLSGGRAPGSSPGGGAVPRTPAV